MKIKELIEKLNKYDQEAKVMIYCSDSEDMSSNPNNVYSKEQSKDLYCKGYSFQELNEERPTLNYVVIG